MNGKPLFAFVLCASVLLCRSSTYADASALSPQLVDILQAPGWADPGQTESVVLFLTVWKECSSGTCLDQAFLHWAKPRPDRSFEYLATAPIREVNDDPSVKATAGGVEYLIPGNTFYCFTLHVEGGGASEERKLSILPQHVSVYTVDWVGEMGADREWRDTWSINLAVSGAVHDGVPEALQISFENRGKAVIRGTNAVLNLHGESGLFGWAVQGQLRNERITIKPGETVTRSVPWSSLTFSDIHGEPMTVETVAKAMSKGRWSLLLTLTDLDTPKPGYDSSHGVQSNRCSL